MNTLRLGIGLVVTGTLCVTAWSSDKFLRVDMGTPFQVSDPVTNRMDSYQATGLKAGALQAGVAANGDFVVAWQSRAVAVGNPGDPFKRAYNANLTPKDPYPVRVNTQNVWEAYGPAIAVRPDGNYDVFWAPYAEINYPQDTCPMLVRGYNADGTERFPPTYVWATTLTGSGNYRVPLSAAGFNSTNPTNGSLVVARAGQHYLYGFKVAQDGQTTTPHNVQFSTHGWTSFGLAGAAVALADTGNGVVIGGNGHPQDPLTQRARYWVYNNANGTFSGGGGGNAAYGTWVNAQGKDITDGGPRLRNWRCDVDMNGSGTGVMVWVINSESNTVTYNNGQLDVVARRFVLSGTTVTFADSDPWLVNQSTNYDQCAPRVAVDDWGRFVVTWLDMGDTGVYARVFNADGTGLDQIKVTPDITHTNEFYGCPEVIAKAVDDSMFFTVFYGYTQTNSLNSGWNLYGVRGVAKTPKGTVILIR